MVKKPLGEEGKNCKRSEKVVPPYATREQRSKKPEREAEDQGERTTGRQTWDSRAESAALTLTSRMHLSFPILFRTVRSLSLSLGSSTSSPAFKIGWKQKKQINMIRGTENKQPPPEKSRIELWAILILLSLSCGSIFWMAWSKYNANLSSDLYPLVQDNLYTQIPMIQLKKIHPVLFQ